MRISDWSSDVGSSDLIECDVIVARLGSVAPRAFVEAMGIEFSGPDREAFPKLSPTFETTVPGIYVIGALAGYPLIKHCMNQGYDVVEFINGNAALRSEGRSVGKECVSTCRSRCSPSNEKKKENRKLKN